MNNQKQTEQGDTRKQKRGQTDTGSMKQEGQTGTGSKKQEGQTGTKRERRHISKRGQRDKKKKFNCRYFILNTVVKLTKFYEVCLTNNSTAPKIRWHYGKMAGY